MSRYIDADSIRYYLHVADNTPMEGSFITFQSDIDRIPTADVQPVVHGKWLIDEGDDVYCSNCLEEALIDSVSYDNKPNDYEKSLFCPHCGAKMDLKREK